MSEEKEKKKRAPISEDKKKYVCDVCGKKCANPQSLKMHTRVHEKKEEENKSFRDTERGNEEEGGGGDHGGWVPF